MMNHNLWTVKDGVVGTLTISNGRPGRFVRARVVRSNQRRRRNAARSLRYERGECPLARTINRVIGAVDPDDPLFCRVAITDNPGLFARGDRVISIHAEHKLDVMRMSRARLFRFSNQSLDEINDYLGGSFLKTFGDQRGRLRKLTLSDLPSELEVVVSRAREYKLAGTSLKVVHGDRILGLHERSIARLEDVICSASRSRSGLHARLASYKDRSDGYRHVREQLRAWVKRLRAQVTELFAESVPPKGRRSEEKLGRTELLEYLAHVNADERQPMFIYEAHNSMRGLLALASGDESLPQFARFARDLQRDLYELVEQLLDEEDRS